MDGRGRQIKCNLCESNDYGILFAAGVAQPHQIVSCRQCGLMYANPQQHVDCEDFALGQRRDDDPSSDADRQYYQKQIAQLPDNLRALKVLDRLLPAKGKLLEIGCFLGLFLDKIRADGWQVVGLEPNRAAAAHARINYELDVIDGVLPSARLTAGEFDAVVMLHVIEHLPDPTETLREISRLLKPNGVLVIETPRFDSLSFKLLGRRERSIQCPGHLFFFTEQLSRSSCKRLDSRRCRRRRVGRTLTVERLLYNLGLITRSRGLQRWLGTVASAIGCDKIRIHINAMDMQRLYAKVAR